MKQVNDLIFCRTAKPPTTAWLERPGDGQQLAMDIANAVLPAPAPGK